MAQQDAPVRAPPAAAPQLARPLRAQRAATPAQPTIRSPLKAYLLQKLPDVLPAGQQTRPGVGLLAH